MPESSARAPPLRGSRRIKASKLPVAPGQNFRKSKESYLSQADILEEKNTKTNDTTGEPQTETIGSGSMGVE